MASLTQIREATAAVLAQIPGLTARPRVTGQIVGDTVVVEPAGSDFLVAMGRGTDTWALTLTVIVSGTDWEAGQLRLDDYVNGSGDRSIRQAIFANRSLGLPETDAHVAAMTGYGGSYEAAGSQHLSATLSLIVHTRGTP